MRFFKRIKWNKRKILTISMVVLVFVMSLGYAALSQYMEIDGIAQVDRSWIIKVTNVEVSTTGEGINTSNTFVSNTVTMNATLPTSNSTVTYTITLENQGNLVAKLSSIDRIEDDNSGITYTISGVTEGETILDPGEINTAIVTIKYQEGITNLSDTTKGIMLTFNYVEDVSTDNPTGDSNVTTFNKESAEDIEFVSEADISTFQEVRVDNKVIDSSNYTITSGSTIVTLKKEYLNTLFPGNHIIEIVSTSGVVTKEFTVATIKNEIQNTLVAQIFSNNKVYADNVASEYVTNSDGIDFGQISSDTNGKGLYYTSTNTIDNKTTYYFRGAIENNYVSFGTYNNMIVHGYKTGYSYPQVYTSLTECQNASSYNNNCTIIREAGDKIVWRIVRINEDNSIRLVNQDVIGFSDFNTEGDNAYVGYMYGTAGATGDNAYVLAHTNTEDSIIKTVLDTWYTTYLSNYSSLFARDAGFCNDRSVAPTANTWHSSDTALGYGDNVTYYGAYNRLDNNNKPQFKCPNQENDLFTLNDSNIGNKKLIAPIGLMTTDEVWYAGGHIFTASNSQSQNYLKIGSNWWLMSPGYVSKFGPMLVTQNFQVNYNNAIAKQNLVVNINSTFGGVHVRPVINLSSDVKVTLEGTGEPGSSTNPYVIVTE